MSAVHLLNRHNRAASDAPRMGHRPGRGDGVTKTDIAGEVLPASIMRGGLFMTYFVHGILDDFDDEVRDETDRAPDDKGDFIRLWG